MLFRSRRPIEEEIRAAVPINAKNNSKEIQHHNKVIEQKEIPKNINEERRVPNSQQKRVEGLVPIGGYYDEHLKKQQEEMKKHRQNQNLLKPAENPIIPQHREDIKKDDDEIIPIGARYKEEPIELTPIGGYYQNSNKKQYVRIDPLGGRYEKLDPIRMKPRNICDENNNYQKQKPNNELIPSYLRNNGIRAISSQNPKRLLIKADCINKDKPSPDVKNICNLKPYYKQYAELDQQNRLVLLPKQQ